MWAKERKGRGRPGYPKKKSAAVFLKGVHGILFFVDGYAERSAGGGGTIRRSSERGGVVVVPAERKFSLSKKEEGHEGHRGKRTSSLYLKEKQPSITEWGGKKSNLPDRGGVHRAVAIETAKKGEEEPSEKKPGKAKVCILVGEKI